MGKTRVKYKKEYIALVKDHLLAGKTVNQFADKVKVHKTTVYRWATIYPKFEDALKKYAKEGYARRDFSAKGKNKEIHSKYKTKFNKLILEVMADGKTIYHFCKEVGIGLDTFRRWRRKHPEFKQFYDIGKAAGCAKAMDKLEKAAFDARKNPANQTLVSLYLYNSYGIQSEKSVQKQEEKQKPAELNITVYPPK